MMAKDKKALIGVMDVAEVFVKICPKCNTQIIASTSGGVGIIVGCPHVENVYKKGDQVKITFAEPDDATQSEAV